MKTSRGSFASDWRARCVLAVLPAIVLASVCAKPVDADLWQGNFGPGGTWNLYEEGEIDLTWADALDEARAMSQMGVQGDLASIQSSDENSGVSFVGGGGNLWIGLTDREGAAPPLMQNGVMTPQESIELEGLGCCDAANAQTLGWAWTSGEPFTFQNWPGNEPNNWDGAPAAADFGYEDAVHLRGDLLWNDAASGYDVDEPAVPTLQPGSSVDEFSVAGTNRFVVEYRTEAAAPFADIPIIEIPQLIPAAIESFPAGGDGFMAVTDLWPSGDTVTEPALSVSRQITEIANGDLDAEVYTKQVPISDVTDPFSNANGGPVLGGEPETTPISDEFGAASDDFIEVWRGYIKVEEAGTYTFQFRTDDGFAAKIVGKKWTNSSGNGALAEDNDVVVHSDNTGDSNTFATIDLPAGVQELQMYWWERGGGAYGEVTTAQGDQITAGGTASYLALGDPSIVPPTGVKPVMTLVGDVLVANVSEADGGASGDIELAREIVLDAISDGSALVRDDVNLLVLKDHGNIGSGRPGAAYFDQAFVFPVNDPDKGGVDADEDNFSTGIFGQLQVDDGDATPDEVLELTIGMFADDGAQVHVKGVDFTDGSANADLSFDIDGDVTLTFPAPTGNTNTFGLIQLQEGVVYDFEGFQYENGGGAGYELWAALGDFLDTGFDPTAFVPLSSILGDVIIPGNRGLAFVAAPENILGDFNMNGVLDLGDIDDLTVQTAGGTNPGFYDLNADSLVDSADVSVWIEDLFNSWVGDANLDGEFNTADLVIMLASGTYEADVDSVWSKGDFDGSGRTDSGDLVFALSGGGYEVGPKAAVAAVPEPSSLVLILMGALAAIGASRRRNS